MNVIGGICLLVGGVLFGWALHQSYIDQQVHSCNANLAYVNYHFVCNDSQQEKGHASI